MALRSLPTPGSTTATWTVPFGKNRHEAASANAPARISPGGISCVMSTIVARGLIRRATPFIVPTNQSLVPKSVVNVISDTQLHGRGAAYAKFVAGELLQQNCAIGISIALWKITPIRTAEHSGQLLQSEQLGIEGIDE